MAENGRDAVDRYAEDQDFDVILMDVQMPVEDPVVEKPQQSKKLVFSEIYMNDLPEAVMDRLALEGAMIKQAFMTYGIDGSRIYKINVLTSDAHEQTLFLGEDGKILK